MKIKTSTKSGAITLNHNRGKLVVRTAVKAGGLVVGTLS